MTDDATARTRALSPRSGFFGAPADESLIGELGGELDEETIMKEAKKKGLRRIDVSEEDMKEKFQLWQADPLSLLDLVDTPASKALNSFINAIRKQRGAFMRARILKRGDTLEALFYNRLSEDRSPAGMSYVEFLCHCHRLIMNKSN